MKMNLKYKHFNSYNIQNVRVHDFTGRFPKRFPSISVGKAYYYCIQGALCVS